VEQTRSESAEGSAGPEIVSGRVGGAVLFLGLLAFLSLAPWYFIGLKFQADMAIVLGATVLLQAIVTVTFVPALADSYVTPQAGERKS
jgi:uncharacterized membrane protein YdfJ with MMPL/SSD domain